MAIRNIDNLTNQLQTDIQAGLGNSSTFTPTSSGLSGLTSDAINSLITGAQTRANTTIPSQEGLTTGTVPTLSNLQLPSNLPAVVPSNVSPVSLGVSLTPAEEQARLNIQQNTRDLLASRGLNTSPAGAQIEANTNRLFQQQILNDRFQKERLLTQEALAIGTQNFNQPLALETQRFNEASTSAQVNFGQTLQAETQRFGEQATAAKFGLTQLELQQNIQASNDLQLKQSIELGLKDRGIQFNQELATFSANLSSALGSREVALNFVQAVQQNNIQEANLILQRQQIAAKKRSSLIGAVGGLIGAVGGGIAGFVATGGNPLGAIAGASVGASALGGAGGGAAGLTSLVGLGSGSSSNTSIPITTPAIDTTQTDRFFGTGADTNLTSSFFGGS